MATNILVGRDVITIDGVDVTADMAEGDVMVISTSGEINTAGMTYNQQMVVAENRSGQIGQVTMRILRGSPTDKKFLASYTTYENDSPSFVCLQGMVEQRLGDGYGNVTSNYFSVSDMVFARKPSDVTVNANGQIEQTAREYTFICLIVNTMG